MPKRMCAKCEMMYGRAMPDCEQCKDRGEEGKKFDFFPEGDMEVKIEFGIQNNPIDVVDWSVSVYNNSLFAEGEKYNSSLSFTTEQLQNMNVEIISKQIETAIRESIEDFIQEEMLNVERDDN